MGKIAILVPTEQMMVTAHNYCQQYPEYNVASIQVISTKDAVMTARKKMAEGIDIIIARGLQSSLIKKYTTIPLIQMRVSAQDMAVLINQAKNIVKKEYPVIAVCGISNMFVDMSYFDKLYDIELRTYYSENDEGLISVIQKAIDDRVDVIIGGETAVDMAFHSGISSLFLSTTEDSLKLALMQAQYIEEMLEAGKKTRAELETILDYSYSGILRITKEGTIESLNITLEQMLDIEAAELVGKNILDVVPGVTGEFLNSILVEGNESALIIEWKELTLYTIFAPVTVDGRVKGAILTLHRTQKQFTKRKSEENASPLAPTVLFDDIIQKSPAMKKCVETARRLAVSDMPVVIRGEAGTEIDHLAKAIHNAGNRKKRAFIAFSCSGLSGKNQFELLFGKKGVISQSNGGTVLIHDIEELATSNQYILYQVIRYGYIFENDLNKMKYVDVRIMVSSGTSLHKSLQKGCLRAELFYALAGMEVRIPSLREREEDLDYLIDEIMREKFKKYGRFYKLTNGGRQYLLNYSWPGNLLQLDYFIERLVLTANKRNIDEVMCSIMTKELYHSSEADCQGMHESVLSGRAEEIMRVLKENRGNREKTAQALGISTTTLWRQMKKYGLEID